MTKTAVDPTLPPQDVEEEEGPYNSSELLDVLGIILGGEATDEMRKEALEALFIKWQIEPEMADVLREMLEDTDFESGFDMFSLYYAIAAECCPDYTHTYMDVTVPFLNPKTKLIEYRKVTVGIVVDPSSEDRAVDALLGGKQEEEVPPKSKGKLH